MWLLLINKVNPYKQRLYKIPVTVIYSCTIFVPVTSECCVKRVIWTGLSAGTLPNSADPHEMPQNAGSDQGLHCCLNNRKFRVYWNSLNPCPAEPRYIVHLQTVDSDQLAAEEVNWSGSALFAIKYVNLYQQSGSSNLIGWKLEMGMAS